MYGLRVVIGEKDEKQRKQMKQCLERQGMLIVGEGSEGTGTLALVRSLQPDIIIINQHLPVLTGLEIANIIEENCLAPVILTADGASNDLLEGIKHSWIFGLLIKPFSELQLLSALELAKTNYDRVVSMEKQIASLKNSLEVKKNIDKAKRLLMQNANLSEAEAHRWIQKQSMNKRMSIDKIAEAVILTYG